MFLLGLIPKNAFGRSQGPKSPAYPAFWGRPHPLPAHPAELLSLAHMKNQKNKNNTSLERALANPVLFSMFSIV